MSTTLIWAFVCLIIFVAVLAHPKLPNWMTFICMAPVVLLAKEGAAVCQKYDDGYDMGLYKCCRFWLYIFAQCAAVRGLVARYAADCVLFCAGHLCLHWSNALFYSAAARRRCQPQKRLERQSACVSADVCSYHDYFALFVPAYV